MRPDKDGGAECSILTGKIGLILSGRLVGKAEELGLGIQ